MAQTGQGLTALYRNSCVLYYLNKKELHFQNIAFMQKTPEDARKLCYPFNKHIRSECFFLLWILQTLNNKHKSVILDLYK